MNDERSTHFMNQTNQYENLRSRSVAALKRFGDENIFVYFRVLVKDFVTGHHVV